MIKFIEEAKGPGFELRISAYEFHYPPVLEALYAAEKRGAIVRIIYDRRKDNPGKQNDEAIDKAKIRPFCIKRMANPSAISHNKFILLLRDGKPQAVLTGGTNFSEGGIFGHTNAVHIVEEPKIAEAYTKYWDLLSADPTGKVLRPRLTEMYDLPEGKPAFGTGVIFSPRKGLDALQWYKALAIDAKNGLFMTFAFGMHPLFQEVYQTSQAKMRYALLEKATRPMKEGPDRKKEEEKILEIRKLPENRFAIGAYLKLNMFDRWLGERLSGLNNNVQYVHTKFMLIDPLSDQPIIVTGSANFSEASTDTNDENMLIIRGNTRAADIYLGEFMRLYNDYAFREWASKERKDSKETLTFKYLRTDDWWKDYFGNTERSMQREYFAGENL